MPTLGEALTLSPHHPWQAGQFTNQSVVTLSASCCHPDCLTVARWAEDCAVGSGFCCYSCHILSHLPRPTSHMCVPLRSRGCLPSAPRTARTVRLTPVLQATFKAQVISSSLPPSAAGTHPSIRQSSGRSDTHSQSRATGPRPRRWRTLSTLKSPPLPASRRRCTSSANSALPARACALGAGPRHLRQKGARSSSLGSRRASSREAAGGSGRSGGNGGKDAGARADTRGSMRMTP